jgi:hypothetical protein
VIEQGLQMLVQADAVVAALCAAGGYPGEVPKGAPLPSWSYRFFGGSPNKALGTVGGLTMRRCEIECYGDGVDGAAQAMGLMRAIDAVLDGYYGVLPDDDETRVDSCLRSDEPMDSTDPERRAFRRKREYEIWFYDE